MARRLLVGATTVAVVLGGGGYAIASSSGSTASYRLATAAVGTVERTLTLGGTVNSSARDDVSFGESGTVKQIYVRPGERVRAGQALAALDPTSADAALLSAKASLAKAKAALASTTSAQTQSVASSSSSSKASSTSGTTAALKHAQDALRAAVQKADGVLQAARVAGTAVSGGCVGVPGVDTSSGHVPTTTPTAAPTDSSTPDATSSSGPTQAQLQQCSAVLSALSKAQAAVASAQQAEQVALSGLARVLSQGSNSSSSASSSPASSTSGGQGANASSNSTNSASRLASDQAQVDQAQAAVVSAQVARDHTVLRAPIGGRVVSVGVSEGGTASTSTAAVTLVGAGVSSVVVSVPLAQIPNIKVGQRARVIVSGSSTPVGAVVSAVGILASTATSGTTTYPVTVSLSGSSPALQGIGASVTIVTGSASHVLSLPSSAITTTGTRSTVAVYSGGTLTTTPVTVGVMGSTTASITSGLKAGQQVALADLRASIPSSTSSGNGLRGFGGGLGTGSGVTRIRSGG